MAVVRFLILKIEIRWWNLKNHNEGELPGSDGEHHIQKKFNTEKKALFFYNNQVINELSPLMCQFIEEQEMVFISTADKNGECDSSIRTGSPGFVKVINNRTIIYPEYKGNGVMASIGNASENKNIGLLFIDFFKTTIGLHVNGKTKIIYRDDLNNELDKYKHIVSILENIESSKKILCYVLIDVEEAYIHCSKHIPLLQKRDKTIHWGTDNELYKGGDAFKVKKYPRPWTLKT